MGISQSSGAAYAEPPRVLFVLEVLGARVSNAESRWGDWWTVGVVGMAHPYVVVDYDGNQTQRTDVVPVQFGSEEDTLTNFDERMVFQINRPDEDKTRRADHWIEASEDGLASFKVAVYDQRTVQRAIRGNPLIGEATLHISHSIPTLHCLELRRSGQEEPCGYLNVQCKVVCRDTMARVLSVSGEHSLVSVIKAIDGILHGADGLDRLRSTLPRGEFVTAAKARMTVQPQLSEKEEHRRLEELRKSFFREAAKLNFNGSSFITLTDDQVLAKFTDFSREFLSFIVDYAGKVDDPVLLGVEWIKAFFKLCIGCDICDGEDNPIINEERLRRSLISAVVQKEFLIPADAEGCEVVMRTGWLSAGWRPGELCPRDQPTIIPAKIELGRGTHGVVWRAKDKCTGKLYAVKDMDVRGCVSQREADMAVLLSGALAHPCIVSLFGCFDNPEFQSRSLIMELCGGGDLSRAIRIQRDASGPYVPPERSMMWVGQIFLALEHLHLTPPSMLVRDVKPANVIVTDDGMIAKLTDFGMSRQGNTSGGKFSFHPKLPPGTPDYVAPEVVTGEGYNFSADLYSFGVLVFVLLTGGLANLKGTATPPRPPCGTFAGFNIKALLDNWKKIRACVNEPGKNNANAMPCQDAADLVLALTGRSKGHTKLDHGDIRRHPLMQHLQLPRNLAATPDWLESVRQTPPTAPWSTSS